MDFIFVIISVFLACFYTKYYKKCLEKSLRGYVLIYYFAYNICRCEYQKKSYSWRF
nr:MAG TPA_asm: hypothetical protein [Caudoviricetes sp.]